MNKAGKQIYLDLPDGWEDKTIYTYMGPDDSGVQHILTLVVDDKVAQPAGDERRRARTG